VIYGLADQQDYQNVEIWENSQIIINASIVQI